MNSTEYPLVSVLIPYYNHNQFIKDTLDSIKADTYPNKEILIINDGSTQEDDSNIVNWINENPKQKVNYIKRKNKGVSSTFNELVKLSKGDYILPCSSDDYLINNTIEKRVNLLKNIKNKKKLILISDNIVIDEKNKLLFNSNLFEKRKVDIKKLVNNKGLKYCIVEEWAFSGPSWIADKELFTKYNLYLDESLILEDLDFFLRIVGKELALFYNEKVSAYRIHNNNTFNDSSKKELLTQNMRKTYYQNSKYFNEPFKTFLLVRSYENRTNMPLILKFKFLLFRILRKLRILDLIYRGSDEQK